MKTKKRWTAIIGLLFAVMFISSTLYAGDAGVKHGTLVIKSIPGTSHNLIIKSSVDVAAVFTDTAGNKEHYVGEMGIKLGVDLSIKKSEEFHYLVFSPSSDYKTGSYALQGKYFGQSASVAVGAGPSVKILLGGFDKSFSLQPLALGGNMGYGATAGLGYLYLQKNSKE